MKATTTIFFDKIHPKKNGECGVSIRITYNRKPKYFKLDYSFTPADYAKIMTDKPRGDFKTLKLELLAIEERANEIIKKIPYFSFEQFELLFFKNKSANNLLKTAFENAIENFNNNNQIGTAANYQCAINSLELYKKNISFIDITVSTLKDYEKWMTKQNRSTTTIGMYLRPLRALFNEKIDRGELDQALYPFGRNKYEIPTSKNKKKALTIAEIKKIIEYKALSGSSAERARDYWLFSYFGNGINFTDLLDLRIKNRDGDKISFVRSKTKNTKREKEEIEFFLNDITKEILRKWSVKSIDPEAYLFPHFNYKMDSREKKRVSQLIISLTNDHMKKIAKELDISTSNITTYYARHSFATILMRSGAPVSFVSKALGHSDLKTTANYLGSFEDTQAKEIANFLIPENL